MMLYSQAESDPSLLTIVNIDDNDRFAFQLKEIEHCWIILKDGCRLAAKLWLPIHKKKKKKEDSSSLPPIRVPAILEYLPYRRRDGTRYRDSITHPYVAAHGYACVRVDMRGSGDSDGILHDEYTKQEQDDAIEVLEWIAAQEWCDGNVGMMGISWGGFNSLQVAARNPPQLKAIITLSSTVDRYETDIHYLGGCMMNENLSWASIMLLYNSRWPDPEIRPEDWREVWMGRLKSNPLLVETWAKHQRRDAYWKHGSVGEDFSKIKIPVFAIGGWVDGYTSTVLRLLEGLNVPRRGIIGPWEHHYPHIASVGPKIGFLQEAVRWWNRWLKGMDNNVDKEPMLVAYMRENCRPTVNHPARGFPGRWVFEDTWKSLSLPSSPHHSSEKAAAELHDDGGVRMKPLSLNNEGRLLLPNDADNTNNTVPSRLLLCSPPTVGLAAGKWWAYAGPDLPGDQREDDGKSLCFDSSVLTERIEILGEPVITLRLSCDQPFGMIACRVCDIHEDGSSFRVSYGLLNMTHRESHEHPKPMTPNEVFEVSIRLTATAYAFVPGHRIRVALSTAYWPMVWSPASASAFASVHNPSAAGADDATVYIAITTAPRPPRFTIETSGLSSKLWLPIRRHPLHQQQQQQQQQRDYSNNAIYYGPFHPAEGCPPPCATQLRPPRLERRIERELAAKKTTVRYIIEEDYGSEIIHDAQDLDVDSTTREVYTISEEESAAEGGGFLSAVGRFEAIEKHTRRRSNSSTNPFCVWTQVFTEMRCTSDAFLFEAGMDAFEEKMNATTTTTTPTSNSAGFSASQTKTELVYSTRWKTSVPRDMM